MCFYRAEQTRRVRLPIETHSTEPEWRERAGENGSKCLDASPGHAIIGFPVSFVIEAIREREIRGTQARCRRSPTSCRNSPVVHTFCSVRCRFASFHLRLLKRLCVRGIHARENKPNENGYRGIELPGLMELSE